MEEQKSLADLTLERERLNEGMTEDRVPTHTDHSRVRNVCLDCGVVVAASAQPAPPLDALYILGEATRRPITLDEYETVRVRLGSALSIAENGDD